MKSTLTILVVDDDRAVAQSLNLHLKHQGYETHLAFSCDEGLARLAGHPVDLLITDLRLGERSGVELLSKAREEQGDCDAIVITAYADLETAIEALKLGAKDYLIKPLNIDELLLKIEAISDTKSLRRTVKALRREVGEPASGIFLGGEAGPAEIERLIKQVADTNTIVLLEGESGTGKNVYARYIHGLSGRRDGPFIVVNCAALTETIIESELFGHARGAFTGAVENRRGLFEQAAGGSILLDEISEMPAASQPKILQVLESGRVRPVGGEHEVPLDCRVMIATNNDLLKAVGERKFREDLYYRISMFRVKLPALRERRSDIIPLARCFLDKHGRAMRREATGLSPDVERTLMEYSYPGNIRELENIIQRAVILCERGTIEKRHLPLHITSWEHPGSRSPALRSLQDVEREHIATVLGACGGNVSRSAEVLGIARSSLWRKIKQYDLTKDGRTT